MTEDNCSEMINMKFSHKSCGVKYYINLDTYITHCACGVGAEFPCSCNGLSNIKNDDDLINITGSLIATNFSDEIEGIIKSIRSISNVIQGGLDIRGIQYDIANEREIMFQAIVRAVEMIRDKEELANDT